MQLKCPHCNENIRKGFPVCPFCRKEIIWCDKCESPLKPDWKEKDFCPECAKAELKREDSAKGIGGDAVISHSEVKIDQSRHEQHQHYANDPSKRKNVTPDGEKCPVCRRIVGDIYGDCPRCGRDFIHEGCFKPDPDDSEEEICKTCFTVVSDLHKAEQLFASGDFRQAQRGYDCAHLTINRAIRKGGEYDDPDLDLIEDRLEQIKVELERMSSDEAQLKRDIAHRHSMADFEPGEIVAGRYSIEKLLGEGGMGKVYLVKDLKMDDDLFALKFLKPELAQTQSGLDRLKKEARRMGKLSHPAILSLWDFDIDGKLAFLKMEYASGGSLEDRLLDRGIEDNPFTPDEVLELLVPLCSGLDYAHGEGIVHRDLKPGNIIFSGDGKPRIMDFGIATVVKNTLSRMSVHLQSTGTPLYMSPEQISNPRKVSHLSDLYSLCCMVFELLNGYPPFPAETAPLMHIQAMPPRIEYLPDRLNDVLQKCLAKSPEDRYQSASKFLQSFNEAVHAPVFPVCPECGEAKDVERFNCMRCGKLELCLAHKGSHNRCPKCEEKLSKWEGLVTYAEVLDLIQDQGDDISIGFVDYKVEFQKRILSEIESRTYKWKYSVDVRSDLKHNWISGQGFTELVGSLVLKEKRQQQAEADRIRKEKAEQDRKQREEEARKQREAEERKRTTPGALTAGPLPGIQFAYIPGGTFMMGSPEGEEGSYDNERPQHKVTLKAFHMQTTPVTQSMWEEVMGDNPSHFKGDDRPVEQVSWDDIQEFLKKLNLQHPGRTYRLPSESEWEYACRAGTTTPFNVGSTINPDGANYDGNYTYGDGRKGVYRKETVVVGSFKPNCWGLYDMHGNVWEWCADVWHDNYQGASSDGSAWTTGGNQDRRVLRGGSWFNNPKFCRSAYRSWDDAYNWYYFVGFRLVFA